MGALSGHTILVEEGQATLRLTSGVDCDTGMTLFRHGDVCIIKLGNPGLLKSSILFAPVVITIQNKARIISARSSSQTTVIARQESPSVIR